VVVKALQRAVGHNIRGRVIAYTAFGSVIITATQIDELRDEIRRLTELITARTDPAYGEGRNRVDVD
jgi:hypothetical protein